jgi:hypothetical protein
VITVRYHLLPLAPSCGVINRHAMRRTDRRPYPRPALPLSVSLFRGWRSDPDTQNLASRGPADPPGGLSINDPARTVQLRPGQLAGYDAYRFARSALTTTTASA